MNAFEELKEWIRERMVAENIGCHVLTELIQGRVCGCPLCLLDEVVADHSDEVPNG